jgi:hypothetical protein
VSIEARLRAFLSRRARRFDVRPDTNDLAQRVRRSTRRRGRVLAAAVALIVVVGPALGFAIGRSTGGSDDPSGTPSVRAERGALGSDDRSGFGSAPYPAPVAPGYGWAGPAFGPLERLFLRTTTDGLAVRAYRASGPFDDCVAPGCPPPECLPTSSVTVGLSNDEAVGFGWGEYYDQPLVPIITSSGFFGVEEGAPAAWAVVQVDSAAARVRVTFADGSTDEMEPVDGIAVLARRQNAPSSTPSSPVIDPYGFASGTVEVFDAAGDVIATADLGSTSGSSAVLDLPECAPPPPQLPEPTGPPPENEAEARAAVEAALAAVYTGSNAHDVRLAAIDDPTGVEQTWEAARANFPQPVSDVTVRVVEVRFLGPTEAAMSYDFVIPDYTNFNGRTGRAVLVDGAWKLTRATVCNDLGLATVSC